MPVIPLFFSERKQTFERVDCSEFTFLHVGVFPFTAGQTSSDRGTNHSISRITEVSDIFPCPVISHDNNCIVWFS